LVQGLYYLRDAISNIYRTCVGLKFAEMEIIDILYHVLKNYRLECVTEGEIGETADVTMKPARDIFLRLHKI